MLLDCKITYFPPLYVVQHTRERERERERDRQTEKVSGTTINNIFEGGGGRVEECIL
jgi:hypothetical protein